MKKDLWVPFDGKAERTVYGWMLRPFEDTSIEIQHETDDVRMQDDRVAVRVGAKARSIQIPEESIHNQLPLIGSKINCGGKSMCVGGIEYCCSDDVAGGCLGYWNKCKK